jgi:hypothetical protein
LTRSRTKSGFFGSGKRTARVGESGTGFPPFDAARMRIRRHSRPQAISGQIRQRFDGGVPSPV